MNKIVKALFLFLVIFQSCKKDIGGTDVLTGKWKLTKVYSNTLSSDVPKPADSKRDFIIYFYNDSAFSGNTFKNTFSEGRYSLSNNNELRFHFYSATKVTEDDWGLRFNSALLSCQLQSVSPCVPSTIKFQGDELYITTPFSDSLTFEKVN